MLDVEVHPNYARNGWIYLAYSEVRPGFVPPPPSAAPPTPAVQPGRGRGPQIPSMTVIIRGKLNKNNEWTDEQVIFRGPPELYTTSGSHFGLRFLFDRDGHLFYSIGERGVMQNSQDLSNPLGKIHRVNDDGSVPKDNPFVSTPGARADDLELRPSQSAGYGVGSCHRRDVGIRAWSERRRRDQHRRTRDATTGGA